MMRINNSIKNMILSVLANIVTIVVGLISQAIFIKILGAEFLGLNGLFSNILYMLGIVELGIGNAIIFNLYKPLANNDIQTTKSLMSFYKKSYNIITIIVLVLGICLMPFLPYLVDKVTLDVNINIIYILFLLDIVFSYVISYKRSILFADQKNYIISAVHIGYVLVNGLLQILVLYLTKNYYLYLAIKILTRFLENFIITLIANKKYSYLKDKNIEKLDKEIEKDIFTKIKAIFFHKIGTFIVQGTDNIIISKFLGLLYVGLYSNYCLIINAVQTLFNQVIQAMTASVGNMLVTEDSKKCYYIFDKIRFLNFWIATFASISVLVIMDSFITIWIGKEYILSYLVLCFLSFNLYQKLMRNSYSIFKESAGIFYEDRFVPLVESLLNIVFSIILCKYMGLAGVFLGTIISGLALWCYSYPRYVYKKLFDRKYINYIIETLGYIILFIIISIITVFISRNINSSNIYIEFFYNIIICVIVPNLALLLVFFKNEKFKYYINLSKNMLRKIRK